MNPAKLIGTVELASRIGVTPKQVDTWAKLGHLKEEPRKATTGSRRAFKPSEVRVAQIMAVLVRAGVAPPQAAKAARLALVEVDRKGPIFLTELGHDVAVTGRMPI